MAIFHLSVKSISRKQGRSIVAAAAYRSGQRLYDRYYGLTHDYTRKGGIVHSEILLPSYANPDFFIRETLWNSVDMAENRKDSRTAREVEIALLCELTLDERVNLVRDFVLDSFVEQGMCADFSIHDKGDGNPHAHVLLTTRPVSREGFIERKNREWDKRENVTIWREKWASAQNREFERRGFEMRVSHESYALRGIDREPTRHLGHRVKFLERHGIQTDRGNENRAIEARNEEREQRQRERGKNRSRDRSLELSL